MNTKIIKQPKLILGVAVNDADYSVTRFKRINGKLNKVWECPFYKTWRHMLKRCYYSKFHAIQPTYINCTVSQEWLFFSNFKSWMEKQNWEGKYLDKDLIKSGNKLYSKETCFFIPSQLNLFLVDKKDSKGKYLIGCYLNKRDNKFMAQCNNPFTGKREYLGLFEKEEDAHRAWRTCKHKIALQYADMQEDMRIADALRTRFI